MTRERWRWIRGWQGRYEVSDMGRVRSWARQKPIIRKSVPNLRGGYLCVLLSDVARRKLAYVHQLVLDAFTGPRPRGHEARHLNGDTGDCRLRNLAWGTHAQNFLDQVKHGTDTRGERNGGARFKQVEADLIRKRLGAGERGRDLAREYGVSEATICRIKHRRRYASS